MKSKYQTLVLFFIAILLFTSCADTFRGLKLEIISPEKTQFSAGDSIEFQLLLKDDIGIGSYKVTGQNLNLKISETLDVPSTNLEVDFSIEVPKDMRVDDNIDIKIEITDTDHNTLVERIALLIIE